jgi:hypothetical protein
MKHPLGNLVWVLVAILALAGSLLWLRWPASDAAAARAVADARQSLRAQGFKTDLADFDFSTPPDVRARTAVLTNTVHYRSDGSIPEHPNLLPPVGNDSAMVVWKLASLKRQNRSSYDDSDQLSWDDFRSAVNQNSSLYDPASEAILSGPIGFNLDASRGSAMLLPHLAVMKNLAQTLGDRTVLDLHDGNPSGAWTNLLAATRLISAYEPEPSEISHMVRFACAVLAYNTLWQALQTNGWTDDQFARLQAEWESVNYFTNLPATVAFQRASAVAALESERQQSIRNDYTFMEFCKAAFQYPMRIWSDLNHNWNQRAYRQHGSYEDEAAVLPFYRDREVELRNAVRAPTWAEMSRLPGVTNQIPFPSKYDSRLQMRMNLRGINRGFQREGSSFLSRAAEVEAERRVLITALALERYRGKHGAYPNSLAALTPEFLKTPLPDFMDGQPLRYRLAEDGHFLLYSIGLDGVDNGGKIRQRMGGPGFERPLRPDAARPEYDLVWPLPASEAALAKQRQQMARAKELQNQRDLEQASEYEWDQAPARLARVGMILATNWVADETNLVYDGRPISEVLRNATGTNRLSLAELLTPRRVGGPEEPEVITFELPIHYEVLTNLGSLTLLADADLETSAMADSGARVTLPGRAANGDSLLAWHTIYDPAGPHAIQVLLFWADKRGGEFWIKGPALSVVTSNLCQFSLSSANFDPEAGAIFHARLPEPNASYVIECLTTNGTRLKTLTGVTTNGDLLLHWDLLDDQGQRFTGNYFDSIVHLSLPDSGRAQTLRGP